MKFIGDALQRHRKFGRRGSAALPDLMDMAAEHRRPTNIRQGKAAALPIAIHHRLREAGGRSELATRRKW
jgi:hypothetical protein